MKSFDLKQLEQKAYRSTFQDGLWDICIGVMILGMGMSALLKNIGIPKPIHFLVFPFIALLIAYAGKNYITIPRMGFVKFGPRREIAKKRIWVLASILTPLLMIFIIIIKMQFIFKGDLSNYVGPLFSTMLFVIISTIISHIIDYPRLFLFGLLVGLSIIAAEILYPHVGSPLDGLIPFSLVGTLIITFGLDLLIRFLKKYPRASKEVDHDA